MKFISRTGRRRAGAALALLVAVGVVVVVILTSGTSPSSPNSSNAANQTAGAATVERRNLVETDTESGTLSYSNPQTVYNRLSGTITWLPSVGQEIHPGGTLYKVNSQPVVMLDGSAPAYRGLHSGISPGADILELNRNLVRLGFNPDGIVIDDTWQAATTAGIEQFQDSLGVKATGSLPLGQVIFLPGDQLISAVEGTLGNSAGGSTAPPTPADASLDPSTPRPEFVDLTTTSTTPTTPTTQTTTTTSTTSATTTPSSASSPGKKKSEGRQTLAALIALLKAEIAQLKASQNNRQPGSGGNPNSGNHGGSHNNGKGNNDKGSKSPKAPSSGGGGGGGGASEILQTTSTHLVVTVDLSASVQSEAVVGEHVQVQMPAGNFVNGTVTAVSSIAQTSSNDNSGNGTGGGGGGGGGGNSGNGNGNGSGSGSTIPVTVTLKGHHAGAGLDQAAVSVNFAQQKASNVLSVPVTALLATSGGNYAVQEAAPPHKLIPVTTGLFAAGDVQISGPGIYSGLQVTDSQG